MTLLFHNGKSNIFSNGYITSTCSLFKKKKKNEWMKSRKKNNDSCHFCQWTNEYSSRVLIVGNVFIDRCMCTHKHRLIWEEQPFIDRWLSGWLLMVSHHPKRYRTLG